MTLGTFIGLIGIPALILFTALICYAITARRDLESSHEGWESEEREGER